MAFDPEQGVLVLFGVCPPIESIMRLAVKPVAFAILLAGCSSDLAAPTTSGPTTAITAIKSTIEGYVLTVKVTNSDTGEIMYGYPCSGRLERRAESAWHPIFHEGICRGVGRSLAVGQSLTFDVGEPSLDAGSRARYVFEWTWMNGGDGTINESLSAPVVIK